MHPPLPVPNYFPPSCLSLRLPRTILIALTGAALAGSGAAYQGLFRNPLADPYLIGVASGAGLGAVIAMSVHWPAQLLGMYTIPISAFLAGMITVVLVYSIARIGKTVPTTNLLLAGVTVSSFCTALTSFLMLRAHNELRRAITWLLGGSTLTGWDPVIAVLPYILVGLTSLILLAYPLNVLQFGEDQAQQLGFECERSKDLDRSGCISNGCISGSFFWHHRFCWSDCSAPGADTLDNRLPESHPALARHGDGRVVDYRYSFTYHPTPARNPIRNYHRPGWGAFLPMGTA